MLFGKKRSLEEFIHLYSHQLISKKFNTVSRAANDRLNDEGEVLLDQPNLAETLLACESLLRWTDKKYII